MTTRTRSGVLGDYGAPPHRIGTYPGPRLHLAGEPTPKAVVPPTRWPQTTPPTSSGIDYTFLHEVTRRRPVRWPAPEPITVRLGADPETAAEPVLKAVVAELRRLTGLLLAVGDPLSARETLGEPLPGQIQVGYVCFAEGLPKEMELPAHRDTVAGLAHTPWDGGACYSRGIALIDTASAPAGSAPTSVGVLRHELAHVLVLQLRLL